MAANSTLSSALQILVAALVCVASLALFASASQSEDSSSLNSASLNSAPSLGHLLRRRSAELQAPPHYYERLAGMLRSAPAKRDDGYWIWMPAHGYMSVPRDEVAAASGDKDSVGNLLRYGRK